MEPFCVDSYCSHWWKATLHSMTASTSHLFALIFWLCTSLPNVPHAWRLSDTKGRRTPEIWSPLPMKQDHPPSAGRSTVATALFPNTRLYCAHCCLYKTFPEAESDVVRRLQGNYVMMIRDPSSGGQYRRRCPIWPVAERMGRLWLFRKPQRHMRICEPWLARWKDMT